MNYKKLDSYLEEKLPELLAQVANLLAVDRIYVLWGEKRQAAAKTKQKSAEPLFRMTEKKQ